MTHAIAINDNNLFTGANDGNFGTYKDGLWNLIGNKGAAITFLACTLALSLNARAPFSINA